MFNRLRLQTFYLCGPMDFDRESGKVWREDLTEWLKKRKALPLDPYHKPFLYEPRFAEDDDMIKERDVAKTTGDLKKVAKIMRPIRNSDLRMVDFSSVLIVHLDLDKKPCGTYDESFLSNRSKKPTLIHCPQGIKHIPDWMFGVLPDEFFFEKWSTLKEYLRHIDEDDDVDFLGRWRFIDIEPLMREVLGLPKREDEQTV